MTETTRIADQLARAFDGDAWSGPSLLATLRGVDAAQASSRPVPAAHSIWELVRHLTTWTNVVRERVATGQEQPVPDETDWPAVPTAATPEAWQQDLAALTAAHTRLLALLPTVTEQQLSQIVGKPGTENTGYILLHGLAQHHLYHAGQVALLRKALEG